MSLGKLTLFGLIAVALLVPVAVFAAGAAEEPEEPEEVECFNPPGMDDRYCDQTGDMVADPPVNEDEWLDPDPLIFTYAPTEDPAVYEETYSDFIAHLEQELGREVRWFSVYDYASQVEAMRAGRLHISGFATGAVQDAVNTAGFVPMVVWADDDGMTGYRMAIIARQDNEEINDIDDVRGKEIAFVSETSNSGYFAPRALLYEDFGMLPGEDYDTVFSGAHDNSILGVYHGDYDAAAIADSILLRMIDGGRVAPEEDWMVRLYESAEFPTTAFGVDHRLRPDLQEDIREAFLSFDFEGTSMDDTYERETRWYEISYEEDWAVLRDVAAGSEAVAEILGE